MLINKYLGQFYFKELIELFFPKTCLNCHKIVEEPHFFLCFICMSEIPLTHHSYYPDNLLEISFKGRVNLFSGTSLMYFEKGGLAQKMIHEMKYNKKPSIASFFGKWLGAQVLESNRFESVDLILSVPLHPDKEKRRGYNQSAYFGRALALIMGKEYRKDLLFRISDAESQTKKDRTERMLAFDDRYVLKEGHLLINRHVLIADDVITSGATFQSVCTPFLNIQGIRLSFACIAFTP